jgi:hypothetical protein
MRKLLIVSVVIISVLYCLPLTVCLALHDDETVKSGGAWRPAKMNIGPDRSASDDEKIDKMLDRSFEKSEIVIPPLENSTDKESGSEENVKSGDDVEQRN